MTTLPLRLHRKGVLLAGASMIALIVASTDLYAADLTPVVTKAPPPAVVQNQWSWWVEGGYTFRPGNDPAVGLTLPPFTNLEPGPGWEAAIGFDYRLANGSPYHFSGQFRYGQNNKGSTNFTSGGFIPLTLMSGFGATESAFVIGQGNASIKEDHWLVDFAVGKDFALGSGTAQAKLGIRIAEIFSDTKANGTLFGCKSFMATTGCTKVNGLFSFQSRSSFLGVGPRLGIDGSAPLGGSWAFDYIGGVAVLFGQRKITASQALSATDTFGTDFVVGQPTAVDKSEFAAVFNLDAEPGISYWVTPTFKVTGSFRFDGYWGALKVIEANGAIGNQNRFYYGPMLRATWNLP